MSTTPSTNTYNRLETLPFSEDSERALRAEVRDGLWMLARQWQMGEFQAEDTGSAILARISAQISPVSRYLAGNAAATAQSITAETPLEVIVEREIPPLDLVLRIEMGRHFLRLLKKAITDPVKFAGYLERYLTITTPRKLKISLPAETADSGYLYSNRRLRQAATLLAKGACIDGGVLYEYLSASTLNKASKWLPAADTVVDNVGLSFVAWFKRVFSQPGSKSEKLAYQEESLEYKFAVSAPQSNSNAIPMRAEGYPGGHLDWYSFDLDTVADTRLKHNSTETAKRSTKAITVIPTETRFSGMPRARWWEFEDGQVNLYGGSADAINSATLVYNEFATIYSNDWMIVPLTLPLGNLVDVESIVVTDTFGQRLRVNAAGSESPDEYKKWDLFSLKQIGAAITGPDYRLLLPQVLDRVQESRPFELVSFVRDEMANMVWGVEDIVPDGLGGFLRGHEASLQLQNYLKDYAQAPAAPTLSNDAAIRFKMGTPVPEHWIPFIAVKSPKNNRDIRLQRSSLPRILEGMSATRVLPRTGILSQPISPYYVNEEEVPRSGVLMTRTWQRTRWFNGQTFTWVGRQKQVGRGEGSSGLRFDKIEPKK